MHRFRILTKTFLATVSLEKPRSTGRKMMIIGLSIFAVFFIFIPVMLGMGGLSYVITNALLPIDCEERGIQLILQVVSLFTLIFGISVVMNEFYFSNDIEFLLPWPLRASHIVASKFTAAYISENIIQFGFVLSCVVGFGLCTKMGILNWILSIVGIVTLPIIPMAYCAVLSMAIMGFTKFVKSKDMIQKFSVFLMAAIILVLIASIGFLQNMDIDNYVATLVSGDLPFLTAMNYIFPGVPLFVKTFSQGSIIALIEYIAVNALAVAVVLGMSELLYFRGVLGLTSSEVHKKTEPLKELVQSSKQHSVAFSYFMKEVRILIRTPVFFTNSIMINFLWPIFIYFIVKVQSSDLSVMHIRYLFAENDWQVNLIFVIGITALSIIMSAINSLSSNAISREGKHFSFMKYIPVSYYTQLGVKAFIGCFFPAVGILIFLLPYCIIVQVALWKILAYTAIVILAVSFISFIGIYIDSIQPKLVWDDELGSMRENYNTFFAMAIAIGFTALICTGGVLIYSADKRISVTFVTFLIIMVLIIADALALGLTHYSSARNIAAQE